MNDEQDIDIREKETVYDGFFRMDRYRLRHRKFDGSWTPEVSREIFERGNAVATLLYDPALDTVVMVEQFRLPAYLAGRSAWCMETPAGIVKPGEELAEVARREALEETGCEIIGEREADRAVHGQHRRQHGDRHGVLWGRRFADG